MSEALDIENYGIGDDDGMPNGRVTGYLGYSGYLGKSPYAPPSLGIRISPDTVKKVNEMCIRNAERKRRKERIKKFFTEFIPGIAQELIVLSIMIAFLAFILL